MPSKCQPTGGRIVTSAARSRLYLLVLGRLPRPYDGGEGTPPDQLIVDLLGSREFAVSTAEPLLDGCYDAPIDLCDPDLQSWAEQTFSLETAPQQPRLTVLARVLGSQMVATHRICAETPWSAGALSHALQSFAGEAPLAERDLDPLQTFARVADGLEILDLAGITTGDATGEVRLAATGGSVLFRLSQAGPSAFCRLDLGMAIDGGEGSASLAVDYGDGFSDAHVLRLAPRGRRRYPVFLAAPDRIRHVRWELTAPGQLARPLLLKARPLSRNAVENTLRPIVGARATGWLDDHTLPTLRPGDPEAQAFRLSRRLSRDLGGHVNGERGYEDWLAWTAGSHAAARHDPSGRSPGFDLVMRVEPSQLSSARATLASLRCQTYPFWTVKVVLIGACPDEAVGSLASVIEDCERVTLLHRPPNSTWAAAFNFALAGATGDWLACLLPGDLLAADALAEVAAHLGGNPDLRFVYADHDRLDAEGLRKDPTFKPDFSPEALLGFDYVERPAFMRVDDVRAVGGWREVAAEGVGYDLTLRITSRLAPAAIGHLSRVLLHAGCGTDAVHGTPGLATILREHLARTRVEMRVDPVPGVGLHLRHRPTRPAPTVSLIVPTRDRADLLGLCVRSIITHTAYDDYEVIVVNNDSREPETLELFESWRSDPRIRVVDQPGPFNFALLNNRAVDLCHGEVVGLINNDVEINSPDWLTDMALWALHPGIGCVGSKLLFPDRRVQHGGVIVGVGGVAAHSHKFSEGDAIGYGRRLALVHNVSAVTAACLLIRRSLYEAVGGLDESLPVLFNDVDFCLKVDAAGYRNIVCPFHPLIHHESSSRGRDVTAAQLARLRTETEIMTRKWGNRLHRDPYYSPNLTRIHENFDFNWI